MVLLIDGAKDKRLNVMIKSPGAVRNFLKANTVEHKINPQTFFFLCEMDPKKAKEDGIEHIMIITNTPNTLNLEMFVPTTPLPRNKFKNQRGLREMILKSVYISETDDTIVSPFTREECRKQWGKVYLHLYGQDPDIMHKAASTVVEWTTRFMKGHDNTKMGIDDTGL